jgi:ubiquinone/menaquinone biosynthesis C-methylase UbiE
LVKALVKKRGRGLEDASNDVSNSDNFDGKRFHQKAKGFNDPTKLPENEEQATEWQEANKTWWEKTPMRYDWQEGIDAAPEDGAYFEEIDQRFFDSVSHYMPWVRRPFDNLIDFEALKDKDVLEIGVGHGSHAELIAPHCGSYTGIDLTETATKMTKRRMELRGIDARIEQMDAERMSFDDQSFDFIWSWGVIHHSANTEKILQQMARVLKPGGKAVVMIYHKSLWKYYVADGLIKGIFQGELFRAGNIHGVAQAATDGAIARHYKPQQWRELCSEYFEVESILITGLKTDVIPLPHGRLKTGLVNRIPDKVTRFMTDGLKFGTFLIAHMSKPIQAHE